MNNKNIKILALMLLITYYFESTPSSVSSASCATTPNNIEICLPYGQGSGRYFPNGTIIKSNDEPKVYYLENFKKRPIESPALLESRFDWSGLVVTSQEAINEIPNGTNLTFRDGSLLSNGGTVYIISDGLKRPFASPEAFLRLGLKWDNVKPVSADELNIHPLGEVVTTTSNYPDGVVIKTGGGKMYLVDDDKRRYIPSPLIFESQFKWNETVNLSLQVAPTYNPSPKGDVFYRDGFLISGDEKVWVMENNKKVPIYSPEVFESLGLSWNMVRKATAFEMSIIPTNNRGTIGKNMKFYPDGTLVKTDDSPQIYLFEKGNLRKINSPDVFFSHGYSFDKVLTFPRRVINQYLTYQEPLMKSDPAYYRTVPNVYKKKTREYNSIENVDPNLLSLDIYHFNNVTQKSPVVIWVHGGGWRTGDKSERLNNKLNLTADEGYILVSVNYRLSPFSGSTDPNRVMYPIHNNDVADAIKWTYDNIGTYGGDNQKMALLGHSAGGHLVSLSGTSNEFLPQRGIPLDTIKGVASIDTEGYDVSQRVEEADLDLYKNAFGTDPAVLFEASPINNVFPGTSYPEFFIAKRGTVNKTANTLDFIAKLRSVNVEVSVVDGSQYDHNGINRAIGAPGETAITNPLKAFFRDIFR